MNEINNTLVEETVKNLRMFATIKSRSDISTEVRRAINARAIDAIEYLQEQLKLQTALAQNGQSAIDTSTRLAEEIFKLTEENKKYKDFIISLLKEKVDICSYCVHDVKCEEEKCKCYIEGVGGTGPNGENYPDYKWNCTDFVFGECPLLEDTPCYKCVESNNKGFEWKGID